MPLQALLESMAEQLQRQAATLTALQEQVAALQRTRLDGGELLARLRALEERHAGGAGSWPSPFGQVCVCGGAATTACYAGVRGAAAASRC